MSDCKVSAIRSYFQYQIIITFNYSYHYCQIAKCPKVSAILTIGEYCTTGQLECGLRRASSKADILMSSSSLSSYPAYSSSSYPSSPPPFLSWKAPVQLTHYNSTCPHTSHYFPSTFPSLLLFSLSKRAVAPSKQRGASVRRGETKSYLSPSSNTFATEHMYLCQVHP